MIHPLLQMPPRPQSFVNASYPRTPSRVDPNNPRRFLFSLQSFKPQMLTVSLLQLGLPVSLHSDLSFLLPLDCGLIWRGTL